MATNWPPEECPACDSQECVPVRSRRRKVFYVAGVLHALDRLKMTCGGTIDVEWWQVTAATKGPCENDKHDPV